MAELHAPSFASAAMNHWININSMVYSDIPHILVDIEAARMQMVIPGCQAGLASTWIIFHWKYEVVETFNFYVRFWYFVACEPATQLMRQGSNWCGVRLQHEGESVTVLTGGCWRPGTRLGTVTTLSNQHNFNKVWLQGFVCFQSLHFMIPSNVSSFQLQMLVAAGRLSNYQNS